MDKMFYVILSYYSRSTNHKKDTPLITVFSLFTVMFFSLQLLVIHCFRVGFPSSVLEKRPPGWVIMLMLIFCGSLVYAAFISDNRYLEIYKSHRTDEFANSKIGKRVYWAYFLLLLISPFIAAMIANKITKGYWV